jgi:neopullulanase
MEEINFSRRLQRIIYTALIFSLIVGFAAMVPAQVPAVEKVEPPNWWVGSTINPVRILVKGANLTGARAESGASGITISNTTISANGHYLFADVRIAENVKPGDYPIKITNAAGTVNAPFSIFTPSQRMGNNQGFLPEDVIYLLMPDRFADGDPSNDDPAKSKGLFDRSKPRRYHGGDLQGIIDHLQYIKGLGVTAIWTTPVYDNNDKLDTKEVYDNEPTTGYHGYGAIDFYGVEEHFGDLAKVKEFVRKAHLAGMLVIQDQVANHTGPYHPWANDPPTPTWFNGTVQNHLSNDWQKWTTMNPRASYETQRRNLEGWFVDILPDLNQTDPEVEKYLIQNSLWWLAQTGFDAIRMDTLPHVPRSFWKNWSGAIHREFPKVNILGELFDGDPALISYFQKGRVGHDGIDTGIDSLFDFPLYFAMRDAFAQGKPVREVSQVLAHDWLYPRPDVLGTFLGNHDVPRFINESGATPDGLKLAFTLMMTSRGIPIIYYGDEIALPGGGDPDNRRDFPGGFPGDARNAFNANARTTTENDMYNFVSKLGALRRQFKPLRSGRSVDLLDEEQQMAYARVNDTDAVIVIINNDSESADVKFDVSILKPIGTSAVLSDALGKLGDIAVSNGIVSAKMPARSAAILTKK